GGTTYPWPLHQWADARVDPNPDSLGVVSVLQDAQRHDRWRPLGDGYDPRPGDWVLFDGHVEVVTDYVNGTLHTIGGGWLPDYSGKAHSYPAPLHGQGGAGFLGHGLRAAPAGAPAGTRTRAGGERRASAARSRRAPSAQIAPQGGRATSASAGHAASRGQSGIAGRAGPAGDPGTPGGAD